ncbi:MAG: zinc-dependent metalloprotease, partial [Myxococcales bacterium]|nr:zinc-dependent metalloprotease [Myxococcales bacterium]
PWYERDYFRVDWSKNLVTDAYDFDLFAVGAAIDGLKYDPGSYYVQDPNDPNGPVFSPDEGYFDVTTKLTARPQVIDTPYGSFPLCYFFGQGPAITCDPAEVTVRISFKKVVDDDFEPEDWTGTKMNAFGWFTQDRYGYDRNYGILDQGWHRFASKYNIWQRSHIDGTQCAVDQWRDANGNVQNYKVDAAGNFVFDKNGIPIPDPAGKPFTKSAIGLDVHRDANNEGTEDECEFVGDNGQVSFPGSRCDEFKNKCDIPIYARQTKTTPLYYGPNAAPDLFASTAKALNSWNLAVKRSVQLGKVVEAKRAGVDPRELTGDMSDPLTSEADLLADQQNGPAAEKVPDIFVLCHNPVIAGDHQACGAPGLKVRLGDLRYSVVDIIQDPQMPSAWGIMTDFDDPLTGEKVQASINEWGHVLDVAAQGTEDIVRWLNGEITNDQIASGQYLSQWVSASKLGTAQYTPAVLPAQEIQSRLGSIDQSLAQLNGLPGAQNAKAPLMQQRLQGLMRSLGVSGARSVPIPLVTQLAAKNLASSLGPSLDATFEATRQKLLGTEWEGRLVTPDVLQWAGFNPQQPFAGDPTTLNLASPLRGLNPSLQKWGSGILNSALTMKNMCVLSEQPEPDSLVALARQAKQLYPLPDPNDPDYATKLHAHDDQLHQWIREQFHTSVIAHEMGHSMGLRHNFTGSFDALNYHTEYWQLRTRNKVEKACGDPTVPHTNGTDCVGPRWIDPVTDQEANGFIWKWASTTVMDYPGDQTQDMNDIGLYDKAAMRFGYADLVDVENKVT